MTLACLWHLRHDTIGRMLSLHIANPGQSCIPYPQVLPGVDQKPKLNGLEHMPGIHKAPGTFAGTAWLLKSSYVALVASFHLFLYSFVMFFVPFLDMGGERKIYCIPKITFLLLFFFAFGVTPGNARIYS